MCLRTMILGQPGVKKQRRGCTGEISAGFGLLAKTMAASAKAPSYDHNYEVSVQEQAGVASLAQWRGISDCGPHCTL
jgi:hypothetical protein